MPRPGGRAKLDEGPAADERLSLVEQHKAAHSAQRLPGQKPRVARGGRASPPEPPLLLCIPVQIRSATHRDRRQPAACDEARGAGYENQRGTRGTPK